MGYSCYKLSDASRRSLLAHFPPRYPLVKADHVTVRFGVNRDYSLPPAADIEVIGYADDGRGIEALVVSVNGETQRPDGSVYHVTLSYDPEKKAPASFDASRRERPYAAVHSNGLIREKSYRTLSEKFRLEALPVYVPSPGEPDSYSQPNP